MISRSAGEHACSRPRTATNGGRGHPRSRLRITPGEWDGRVASASCDALRRRAYREIDRVALVGDLVEGHEADIPRLVARAISRHPVAPLALVMRREHSLRVVLLAIERRFGVAQAGQPDRATHERYA